MYKILPNVQEQAKKLNVDIKPSVIQGKKLDVYKNGKKLCSIGDINYSDYSNYIKSHGLVYANEKRRLYKIRHKKDLTVVGTPGYYASKILWQ